ncbi:hypothetical protein [Candidatus Enterococcus clewellii]|uniref:DUF5648 domain-containing protein n=1 Tax=Candidatus Enterococcus clewellii TaxID=1834193 RepID=A0AAQ3VT55_9ENTE
MKKVKVLLMGFLMVIAFSVFFSSKAEADINGGGPVYRLYNPKNGDHLYTQFESERDHLVRNEWRNETYGKTNFYFLSAQMYTSRKQAWRLYNPKMDRHMLTTDSSERAHLVKNGWNSESTAMFMVYTFGEPIYRMYNPNNPAWVYVRSAEANNLVRAGWQRQRIEFYVEPM